MIKPLFLSGCVLALTAFSAGARISVDEIQPPHWWTGMKSTQLQLQVYGNDIKNTDFSLDYPGVTVDSVARLDGSDNWQYIYLSISPDARPGEMKLTWTSGKEKVVRKYQLRQRKPMKGAQGFSSADVLYLIMPDRFADGNPANNEPKNLNHKAKVDRNNLNVRHGGDISGIMNHLDYIDSLGVTAVWVNPVLENDVPGGSYHGYATTNYYRIDPRFGTNEEYALLIDSLHHRGIKTIMDMIFNHSGYSHPWVENPPASDWFNFQDNYHQTNYRLSTITDPYASDYDKDLTVDGWFVFGMPDLNQRNPHLMKYLSQNSIWWIEESGIDGIRMDTYPYADIRQMARWIDDVKAEYPDFNIVGECWLGETAGEAIWQKGSPLAALTGFDTNLPVVMDFPLMIKSKDLAPFREQTDSWNGLNKIYDHLALDYVYPDPNSVLRFLDNHDTERMILEVPENLDQWKQAVALLLTIPGIPQIYYGTELLMAGDRKHGDGAIRRDMPGGFPGDSVNSFERVGRTALQNEAYDWIASINKWRKTSGALTGGMKHFMPTNGLYLYQRLSPDREDEAVVVMNGRDEELKVDMERYLEIIPKGKKFRDVVTGEIIQLIPDSDDMTVSFSPREVRILEPVK